MEYANEIADLRERILQLQAQSDSEYASLVDEFENLNPGHIIMNKFRQLASNTEVANGLIIGAAGVASAYLSKKIIVGKANNPLKQLLGLGFQFAITSLVAKNASSIKSNGKYFINRVFHLRQ